MPEFLLHYIFTLVYKKFKTRVYVQCAYHTVQVFVYIKSKDLCSYFLLIDLLIKYGESDCILNYE